MTTSAHRSKAKGGRPTKLTPEVQEKILTAIRAGNYGHVAAKYAGIGERTFYRWMAQGEKARAGKYRQFRQAVEAAESEAEVRAVAIIQKQMPDNWRAALSYLERKHPKRWGRRMDVTSGDQPLLQPTGILVVPQRDPPPEREPAVRGGRMSKTKKRGAGRPPIEFDLSVVEGLGRIGATINDMVHVLPASKRTLAERMADHDGEFRIAYERGRALLNSSLRRKQIAVAMAGNVTMLIWLGKQNLAQQDRVAVNAEEGREYIDRLGNAGDAAKEAGDEAGLRAAHEALRRIAHGEEQAEVVYLEWLRAQGRGTAGADQRTLSWRQA